MTTRSRNRRWGKLLFLAILESGRAWSQPVSPPDNSIEASLQQQILANFRYYAEWQSQDAVPNYAVCSVKTFESNVMLYCLPNKVALKLKVQPGGECFVSDIRRDHGFRDFSLGNQILGAKAFHCGLNNNVRYPFDLSRADTEIDPVVRDQLSGTVFEDFGDTYKATTYELLIPKIRKHVRFFDVYLLRKGQLYLVFEYGPSHEDGQCCVLGLTLTGSAKRRFPVGAFNKIKAKKTWFHPPQ